MILLSMFQVVVVVLVVVVRIDGRSKKVTVLTWPDRQIDKQRHRTETHKYT